MPLKSRLTIKGQVTVPIAIRRKLGLRQGDTVEFAEKGNEAVLRRSQDSRNPFDHYKGKFKGLGGDLRAIKRWMAELRDDEDRR